MDFKKCKESIKKRIVEYITDENLKISVLKKIDEVKIEILDNERFKEKYLEFGGSGFFPAAFVYNETVYLQNCDLNYHKIVHEIMHAISESKSEDIEKSGLEILNKKEKYYYGRGFNEAFTEYMASLITNEDFQGYTKDFLYVFKVFMEIIGYNIEDILSIYLKNEEWYTEEMIRKFDDQNKTLDQLIIEFDNRLAGKGYNQNNVMKILLDAINNKITNGINLNNNEIMKSLTLLSNHYYDYEYELTSNIKVLEGEVLDRLGTYNINKK